MRVFWTLFFVGSLLLIGADVRERRESTQTTTGPVVNDASDAGPIPTPRP